jgi:hypothetical protein
MWSSTSFFDARRRPCRAPGLGALKARMHVAGQNDLAVGDRNVVAPRINFGTASRRRFALRFDVQCTDRRLDGVGHATNTARPRTSLVVAARWYSHFTRPFSVTQPSLTETVTSFSGPWCPTAGPIRPPGHVRIGSHPAIAQADSHIVGHGFDAVDASATRSTVAFVCRRACDRAATANSHAVVRRIPSGHPHTAFGEEGVAGPTGRSAALEARAKAAYDLRCVTLEAICEDGAHQAAEPSAQEIDL